MVYLSPTMWITILSFLIQAIGIGGMCIANLNNVATYQEGSEVVLQCSITRCVNYTGPIPHPVTWTKGGSKITKGVTSEAIKNIDTRSSLTITFDKSDNNLDIMCSSPAASSVSKRLNVTYKPVVTITTTTNPISVQENSQVSLTCTATQSNPPPTSYQWTFKGTVKSSNSQLRFSVTRADDGEYICSVTNTVGTSTKSTVIDVTYAPSSVSLSPNETVYELTEGIDEMPQVNCTADCNPSCTYNWGRTRLNVLDLGLIRRADAGTHTCLASNGLGRASASIEVKVNYPPDIAFVGKQVRMEGERLQLYCRVSGVPANYTFYEWYQVSPLDNKRVQSGNMSNEGRAQLPSLSYIHNGIYYCSVSNGVPTPGGQTNITGTILNLRVNGPFHDLQAMYTKTGYAGADIKFLIDFFKFSTGQITRSWYNASSGEAVSIERGSITLENIDYQTTFFSTNVTVNGYRVITTITNLTVWDYGIYVLHLESSEQTRVVQLRVDREIATSNTTNGWLISTIILLLVLAGCGLVVGIWIYRRGNCNKGAFTRCLAIEKDRTSDEEDNVDQNNSDNQAVDASQYDPSVYTPLQIHRQHLPESPYSNLQSQSEHTYECLKTKNNSRSPVAAGGQSSNVDQESPSAMMEAASLYQNVNINTNSHHGNKETRLPPKPKPKQTKTRKKAKLPRDTEAHYNGAFKEREEM